MLVALLFVLLPACGDAPADNATPAKTDPPANAAAADTATPTADHPIAKRSAFPEEGETIDRPIPFKRLSDEDQFAAPIDPGDIPAIVRWQDAGKYVGHEITVEGTIAHLGQSRDGKVNFLNFDTDWRGKFYMVIFDDLADTLDQSIEALFKDKLVRVKGNVETHRGRPQIRITSMDQVEFVGD